DPLVRSARAAAEGDDGRIIVVADPVVVNLLVVLDGYGVDDEIDISISVDIGDLPFGERVRLRDVGAWVALTFAVELPLSGVSARCRDPAVDVTFTRHEVGPGSVSLERQAVAEREELLHVALAEPMRLDPRPKPVDEDLSRLPGDTLAARSGLV